MWNLGGKHYHFKSKFENIFLGTPRERNQRHCYDFPSENNGWRKFGTQPVYGDSLTGTVFDPYVYMEDSTFLMCASERKSGDLILLSSKDGKQWNYQLVMLSHISHTWEHEINRGCVVKKGNVYYLWYTGQQNGVSKIGLAISHDGKSYQRVQTSPVLQPELPKEGVSVMNPCVLWDDDIHSFRMWYSAGENYEPDVICYAESTDGIHWEKKTVPVLGKMQEHIYEQYKVGGCNVHKIDRNHFVMYYIGYQNVDVARICFAISADGRSWHRNFYNLLISPSENSWDAHATYKPSVVAFNDSLFLYYNGRKNAQEYIGLALKRNR